MAVLPVERRAAAGLSYDEFLERYLRRGVPVVITGLAVPKWSFEHLEELCGDRDVPRLRHTPDEAGRGWAALSSAERASLREHLQSVRAVTTSAGKGSSAPVLFDHALNKLCPELLDDFLVPRYFAVDYLRAIPKEARGDIWPSPDSFPSLFAQPAGTRCGLHVDQAGTYFYQMLIQGRKRWRLFRPEDAPRLYPRGQGLLFEADVFDPNYADFPLLRNARAYEAVLEPGEVIFVPQGSPHQVMNEEASLAVSANYVSGNAGVDVAVSELKLLAQGGSRPEYLRAAEALQRWAPSPDEPMPPDPGDLPWRDFDAASWLPRRATGTAQG